MKYAAKNIYSMENLMSINYTHYGMQKKLDLPYDQAVEKVTTALKEQGFGVLTTIDVKQTMRMKLDKDFRRYVILGACNPPIAFEALTEEREIGLLLPCNVIVYEEGEGSVVSILDPEKMLALAQNSKIEPGAQQAKSKLQQALETL
jgi:uncharacterized protein (DUF302 family)